MVSLFISVWKEQNRRRNYLFLYKDLVTTWSFLTTSCATHKAERDPETPKGSLWDKFRMTN